MAHHRSWAKRAITESAAMEEAVQLASNMTSEEDTLLIVTSDHTHTMSLNGYPDRGSNIFGKKTFCSKIISYAGKYFYVYGYARIMKIERTFIQHVHAQYFSGIT